MFPLKWMLLLLLIACGPTSISASSYDQSCSAAFDCVVVVHG